MKALMLAGGGDPNALDCDFSAGTPTASVPHFFTCSGEVMNATNSHAASAFGDFA